MNIYESLLGNLDEGRILEVLIGLRWTAVAAEVSGEKRCGLAATMHGEHAHTGDHEIPLAGNLESMEGWELAQLIQADGFTLRSVGAAAINALLPRPPQQLIDINAEVLLAELGRNKRVVLVGHFPFVPRLRQQVGELHVLELNPREGDLPADAAPDILPDAEVIAITSITMLNRTLQGLLNLCLPGAFVMLLGPSTPLSPLLYEFGIHMLSGSLVENIDPVLKCISQGADFKQVHRAGVRLVTITSPESPCR